MPNVRPNHRSKSFSGEPIRPCAGSRFSGNSALAALNKTQHCASNLDICPARDVPKAGKRGILGVRPEMATPRCHDLENRSANRTMCDRRQMLQNLLRAGMRCRGYEKSSPKRHYPVGRKSLSTRNFAEETDKMKGLAESVSEFQLNLPSRQMRDSISFIAKSKAGQGEGPNPCRQAIHSIGNQSSVKASVDLLDRCSFFSFCSGKSAQRSVNSHAQNERVLDKQCQDEESFGTPRCKQHAVCVGKTCSRQAVGKLVGKVHAIEISLRDRKTRLGALRKVSLSYSKLTPTN